MATALVQMHPVEQRFSFEQTVMPHLDAAYNLARWLTRNDQDAEDVVQEAYLRAFRFFDGFRGGDGRAWLLAVVRNTCLTWLRQRGRKEMVEFDEQAHAAEVPSTTPETALLRKAALGSVKDCLEALPVEYREAFVLRELEDMSYKEIADVSGVPIGTVMSRLSRARKRLQSCLGGTLR
ncbi:MAG TPA: sigma-70 family RNA polymerase sigma factor [Bryobacteraceae bacterium]|nr:sigma-70 family RNA polymerase sigma factor [Bryobacteraceae bacterium]